MAFVNFATREITAKIVYYGPGLGGKTTSLQCIHSSLPVDNRGKMISLATEEDRTIYFDFLPLNLGKIQDFAVRVQLYTVPGQVRYNATRKLVLRGADGLVFVADCQKHKKLSNLESFNNMEENLNEHGKDLRDLPHILQFNKIDLPNRTSSDELNLLLNKYNVPHFETCATKSIGVLDALKSITKLVFNDLGKKALLQKKSKTTSGAPAVQYSVEQALMEKPAPVPEAPAPIPNLYSAENYGSDLPAEDSPKLQETYHADPPYDVDSGSPEMKDEAIGTVEPEDNLPPFQQESIEEVEPLVEFEEVVNEDTPFQDYSAAGDEQTDHVVPSGFSYEAMFEGSSEIKTLLDRLERQISEQQNSIAVITARAAFSLMVNQLFPKEYVLDSNETSVIVGLNLKFQRFLRFKKLLDAEHLRTPDLLFIHHFLCDIYLSIKEL